MVQRETWWAAGVAVPVGLITSVLQNRKAKRKRTREDRFSESETDGTVACQRVCDSDSLRRKLKISSEIPASNSCVTICGVSAGEACIEACRQTVCAHKNGVPTSDDACLQECKAECLLGKTLNCNRMF